jgi:hypothetical protein
MNFLLINTVQQPKIYLIMGRIVYTTVVFMEGTVHQGIHHTCTCTVFAELFIYNAASS